MIVAIVLAAVAILVGIVVVALGKGGEMSTQRPPLPTRTDFSSAADVAEFRPPPALIGYHAAVTERALTLVARALAERDAEIDWLRARLGELQPERMSFDPAATSADAAGSADRAVSAFGPARSAAGHLSADGAVPADGAVSDFGSARAADGAVSASEPVPAGEPVPVGEAVPASLKRPAVGARWQGGGSAGMSTGFARPQPVSGQGGEDV